jgi:hypothetical protein
MDKKTIGMILKILGFGVGIYFALVPIITIAIAIGLGNPEPTYSTQLLIAMVCSPPLMYFGYKFSGQLSEE